MFRRYTSKMGLETTLNGKQMWDLLIVTGGPDMEDLIQFQSGIQTKIPALVPTKWEAGIEMARAAINQHTNQTTARNHLFTAH